MFVCESSENTNPCKIDRQAGRPGHTFYLTFYIPAEKMKGIRPCSYITSYAPKPKRSALVHEHYIDQKGLKQHILSFYNSVTDCQ